MTDWRERARCAGRGTDEFYPDREDEDHREAIQAAKDFCRGFGDPCPVIRECLISALLSGDTHGIWGGLSNRERRALFRKRDLPSWITRTDLAIIGAIRERQEREPYESAAGDPEAPYLPLGFLGEVFVIEPREPRPSDGCTAPVGDHIL